MSGSGLFWNAFERSVRAPRPAAAGGRAFDLLQWKHIDPERAQRVACSIVLAALPHAIVMVWVASLGAMLEAPPPRLVVSLEALSPGSAGPAGGARRGSQPAPATSTPSPAPVVTAVPPPPLPDAVREAEKVPTPIPAKPVAEVPVPKPKAKPAAPKAASPKPVPPRADSKGDGDAAGKPVAGPAAEAGSTDGHAKGGGSGDPGAGAAGLQSGYRARLLERLARHKRYPARARAMGLEAQVMVRITIGRDGRVRTRSAEAGSGAAIFAREAEAMVDRANPFPAVPQGLEGAAFEFRVPVEFRLDGAGG